jgi:hypothetical protein
MLNITAIPGTQANSNAFDQPLLPRRLCAPQGRSDPNNGDGGEQSAERELRPQHRFMLS